MSGSIGEIIPLLWIKNDLEGARFAFRQEEDLFFYLGAPVQADFPLSYETLAPYVIQVLDLAAPIEGAGIDIKLVEIKGGKAKVW
jgi:hypothetical protein